MINRNTRQRKALLRALNQAAQPLSPAELLQQARRDCPRLGLATVYRQLQRLVDEGSLRVVELPGLGARYESTERDHHHHFRCRHCDNLFSLSGCPGDMRELAPSGFIVEAHEIVLTGLCRRCATGGEGATP